MNDNNVGKYLKKIREELNITQEEVASKLNLGRDAIIRIEKGTRKISALELKKLSDIYNLDINDILSYKENDKTKIKGIILAGGSGTRFYPVTKGISKQLLPVYDKPMIYYPLSILMQASIKDILIITTKEDQSNFKRLLGNGSRFGINLEYKIQNEPNGLAEAFTIGEDFIGNDVCAMILGDNIFYGSGLYKELNLATKNAKDGLATIFGYQVKDPQRFGIIEFDKNKKVIGIEEKPNIPKSEYAVTGLYFYPSGVSNLAKKVKPSKRKEYEITDLNEMYLKENRLNVRLLNEGYSWFDTGTFDSLLDASNMIKTIETNRDSIICSPEKIAYENGWIKSDDLKNLSIEYEKNIYGRYLGRITV